MTLIYYKFEVLIWKPNEVSFPNLHRVPKVTLWVLLVSGSSGSDLCIL